MALACDRTPTNPSEELDKTRRRTAPVGRQDQFGYWFGPVARSHALLAHFCGQEIVDPDAEGFGERGGERVLEGVWKATIRRATWKSIVTAQGGTRGFRDRFPAWTSCSLRFFEPHPECRQELSSLLQSP